MCVSGGGCCCVWGWLKFPMVPSHRLAHARASQPHTIHAQHTAAWAMLCSRYQCWSHALTTRPVGLGMGGAPFRRSKLMQLIKPCHSSIKPIQACMISSLVIQAHLSPSRLIQAHSCSSKVIKAHRSSTKLKALDV